MSDRTVHAETPEALVVRYDRAGVWRIEDKGPVRTHWGARFPLRHVVEWLTTQDQREVTYHFGVKGGLQFDKRVKAELERIHRSLS
jgi:hypothetical protein